MWNRQTDYFMNPQRTGRFLRTDYMDSTDFSARLQDILLYVSLTLRGRNNGIAARKQVITEK